MFTAHHDAQLPFWKLLNILLIHAHCPNRRLVNVLDVKQDVGNILQASVQSNTVAVKQLLQICQRNICDGNAPPTPAPLPRPAPPERVPKVLDQTDMWQLREDIWVSFFQTLSDDSTFVTCRIAVMEEDAPPQ